MSSSNEGSHHANTSTTHVKKIHVFYFFGNGGEQWAFKYDPEKISKSSPRPKNVVQSGQPTSSPDIPPTDSSLS
jgi:hypothetical protein